MTNSIQGIPQTGLGIDGGMSTTFQGAPSGEADFMGTLRNAMEQVNQLQSEADGRVTQLLSGNGQDVHSAMIAVEKASLAFQMMVQVRNKIVQAYQQVSAIPF